MAVYLAQMVNGVASHRILLDKQLHSIGRRSDNDILIDDTAVSGHHAVIEAREDDYLDGHFGFFLKDLNSTNGTYVNDLEITEERRLNNYDLIRFASHIFKFIDEDAEHDGSGTTLDLGA
jgi:pSer/pThr/pTyr-binding forkhead associated (FHA) protein